jgi:RNA polymerase sigma factor (sigma-70 family)
MRRLWFPVPPDASDIVTQHAPLAVRLVKNYLHYHPGSEYLADDLLSVALLTIVQTRSKLKNIKKPTSFLAVSARRAIYAYARKEERADRQQTELWDVPDEGDAELADLYELLDKCCESTTDRDILRLREAGLTLKKTASVMHIKYSELRTRYYRLKKKVFQALQS